jgi:hypothetical protein
VSEMSIIEEEAVLELVWITPNKNFVGMSSINKDIYFKLMYRYEKCEMNTYFYYM